jgi:hypothetical protein
MRDRRSARQVGATTILVLTALVSLLGFAAFALDLGYVYVTRIQLQNTADAAALAGGAELGKIYTGIPPEDHPTYQLTASDGQAIVTAAVGLASQHRAGSVTISLPQSDVQIGRWDFQAGSLTVTNDRPTTVRAFAKRTEGVNGPISALLGQVLSVQGYNAAMVASAALTPIGSVGEGGSTLPAGISKAWFANSPETCDQPIRFHPTGDLDGCAGWHTYVDSPANANRLRNTLDGLADGSFTSPALSAGDQVEFTGGTVASAFEEMKALYEVRRFEEAPYDQFEDLVVVYDRDDCSNPHGPTTVVGFASVIVTDVREAPDKVIDAVVKCDIIEAGPGGGGGYGTLGSIPVLIE